MKRIKWLITAIIAMSIAMSTMVYGQEDVDAKADYLNALLMLRGTENGYELNNTLNRVEAAVMIVRLRGGEAEALAAEYAHPFLDVPSWADPYIGYMYHYKLTTGQSPTSYGSADNLTTKQYVTFLLRALGYDDVAGDFKWNESLNMAQSLGLSGMDVSPFNRGAMVDWTFEALSSTLKNSKITLLDYLKANEVIPNTTAIAENFYWYETYTIKSKPFTYTSLKNSVQKMAYDFMETAVFDVSNIENLNLEKLTDDVSLALAELPMYSSVIKGYKVTLLGNQLTVNMTYNIDKKSHEQAVAKAKAIILDIIDLKMNAFEKEKAIHDYIVNAVSYNESLIPPSYTYTVYGALVQQSAVCHGYAESFRYLSYLAGLEVDLVIGEAIRDGKQIGHAWNMITLDGEAYHVDTTWDDPLGKTDGLITYAYFNVTDETLMKDHLWDIKAYDSCNAKAYNYYVYEDKSVIGTEGLKTYIMKQFENNASVINVRVEGHPLSMADLRSLLVSCNIPYDITYKVDHTNVVTIKRTV